MKRSSIFMVFAFAAAIGGAVLTRARASGFNVTGYTADCANSASVDCIASPNPTCTHDFGGTIGLQNLYEKDPQGQCDITLALRQ